jgi:hypothetical protein
LVQHKGSKVALHDLARRARQRGRGAGLARGLKRREGIGDGQGTGSSRVEALDEGVGRARAVVVAVQQALWHDEDLAGLICSVMFCSAPFSGAMPAPMVPASAQ